MLPSHSSWADSLLRQRLTCVLRLRHTGYRQDSSLRHSNIRKDQHQSQQDSSPSTSPHSWISITNIASMQDAGQASRSRSHGHNRRNELEGRHSTTVTNGACPCRNTWKNTRLGWKGRGWLVKLLHFRYGWSRQAFIPWIHSRYRTITQLPT